MRALAAMDISVLGTALVYRRHQTGVHRMCWELLRYFATKPDLRLELLNSGRAAWLEFPSRIAFEREWSREGWVFLERKTRVPGIYPLLLLLARIALSAKEKNRIGEKALVGGLKILGALLSPTLPPFSARVYYSPAHALPKVPEGVRRCITLYDMIPIKFPQWYDESDSFRKIIGSIGPEDTVAAISECSRRDWLEYSHLPAERAEVIPCGVAEDFFPREDAAGLAAIRKKYGVGEGRLILAVGTLEPRKNLELLVRAFLSLREDAAFRDTVLLLIGPKGWKNDDLFALLRSRAEAGEAVRLSGFVPDEDLPWLYSACDLFVFPSLYEGFGLPVAEALKCGAAVMCGRHSSLPEVAGDAVEYVDVHDVEALREGMRRLVSDPPELARLREKARERGRIFAWKDAGEAYLSLFSRLSS
jgi:glycosyltransferase involved in cell wall biosynthesis